MAPSLPIVSDTMQQYCHDDMEDVLDDLPTSKTTVYCCNNGDVTSTQCGGLGQLCKDACGDITCVKFHPRPEEAVCHPGDNHMIISINGQGCKTVSCGASARRSCACCLNRGYYMSCMTATNPDNTCRCKCQCNKYKHPDLCDMEMWCSQCKKYKRLCPGPPMSHTTEQETVGSGGTDTFTSISPGACREGSYVGIWPAKISAFVPITNLIHLIQENYQEQNLVTWNTDETEACLALPDWKFVSNYSGWCSTCPGISLAGSWRSGADTKVTTIPNLTINQCRENCRRSVQVCKGANWNMATWDCVLLFRRKYPMTFNASEPWCALSGTNNKERHEI